MQNRIKFYRKGLRMAQEDLAVNAGISRPFLSTVETGSAVPSVKVAQAIARALGQSVDDLFPPEQEEVNLMNPKTRSM